MKKESLLGSISHGLLFIVSAPSGTGKTTLVDKLLEEFSFVARSISYTTREPRSGEENGKDYFFVTKSAFEEKMKAGDFLESAEVFGHYYGTSCSFVEGLQREGKHVILVIDTQGAMQLKEKVDGVLIFIRPPSMDELHARLAKRQTETSEVVEQRIACAGIELETAKNYDYQIVNDDLDSAYQVLRSIIIAEEHKTCHLRQFFTKKG